MELIIKPWKEPMPVHMPPTAWSGWVNGKCVAEIYLSEGGEYTVLYASPSGGRAQHSGALLDMDDVRRWIENQLDCDRTEVIELGGAPSETVEEPLTVTVSGTVDSGVLVRLVRAAYQMMLQLNDCGYDVSDEQSSAIRDAELACEAVHQEAIK